MGGFYGALRAAWTNSPKHAELPLSWTLRQMGSHGALFGGCAAAFAGTSSIATNFSTSEMIGSVAGGLASGAVLGAYQGSIQTGVVAGLVFGGAAVLCDLSGGSMTQSGEREYKRIRSFNPVPAQS
mgnify:FL=1|jgi:hypothetical protein|tara:strand:- start:191 stop:568 length:378 start_codon:yes stop_codon:yes gene_type:complete